MPLDVARVRGLFGGLTDGWIHADGPAGSLVPDRVAGAIATALSRPIANSGGVFPASQRADAMRQDARIAVADLLGADPSGVVLGPNMTTLTYAVSRALAATWRPGDEIVVSRLDHDANVRPWLQAAARAGVIARWAEIDVETCELPEWQYDELIGARTRLVAVTAASNAVGTRPAVAAIADRARAAGALVYVDAVHAAAHVALDVAELGADFLAVSAYKWCGPHIGAVAAAPDLLDALRPDKLVPAPDRAPERFETGTPPFELFPGVVAAVDHIADLTAPPGTDRRQRVLTSMRAVEEYESALLDRLLEGLYRLPRVTVLGRPERRTPTVSLVVDGLKPRQVVVGLARHGVCAWDGDYYARELMDALGVSELGGAVRLGLAHYTSATEVDRIVAALGEVTA